MMIFKNEVFPVGTQLIKPDGSRYIFLQAGSDFEMGQFVDRHMGTGRLVKWSNAATLPPAVVTETFPKDYYGFVLIHNGQTPVRQANPSGGLIVTKETHTPAAAPVTQEEKKDG